MLNNRVKHQATKRPCGYERNCNGISSTWADSFNGTRAKSSLLDCSSCPPFASDSNRPAFKRTSRNYGSKVIQHFFSFLNRSAIHFLLFLYPIRFSVLFFFFWPLPTQHTHRKKELVPPPPPKIDGSFFFSFCVRFPSCF